MACYSFFRIEFKIHTMSTYQAAKTLKQRWFIKEVGVFAVSWLANGQRLTYCCNLRLKLFSVGTQG